MEGKRSDGPEIVYPELSFKINGVLFNARKSVGGFKNEKQYCDAIEFLLKENGIVYKREKILPTTLPDEQDGRNRVDFLIDEEIVLEVKSKPFLTKNDYYQVKRYLECLDKKLGILVNMRGYYIRPKRILNPKATVIRA